jgi:hypothetical protein
MTTYTDHSIEYVVSNDEDSPNDFRIEVPLSGISPSVAEWDAAIVAFADEIESSNPGYINQIGRSINAVGNDGGNSVWTP